MKLKAKIRNMRERRRLREFIKRRGVRDPVVGVLNQQYGEIKSQVLELERILGKTDPVSLAGRNVLRTMQPYIRAYLNFAIEMEAGFENQQGVITDGD